MIIANSNNSDDEDISKDLDSYNGNDYERNDKINDIDSDKDNEINH